MNMQSDEIIDLVFKRKRIENAFFNHHFLMFLVVESDTGISTPSDSFKEFFGYEETPSLNDMMHPEDWVEATLMHKFILETGEMPIDFHHYRLQKKDGSYARVQTMRSAVLNEKRDLLAVLFPIKEGEGITVYTDEFLQWKERGLS